MSIEDHHFEVFRFHDDATRQLFVALCAEQTHKPCWPLVTDGYAALTDKRFWPDHLCGKTINMALEMWASQSFPPRPDDRPTEWELLWAKERPLPIGTTPITNLLRLLEWPDPFPFTMLAEADRLAVFAGGEKALFIAEMVEPDTNTTVEAFFLVQPAHGVPLGQLALEPQGVKFRVRGDPLHERVQTFCRMAGQWWDSLTGVHLPGPGRPRGSGRAYSLADIDQLLNQSMDATGNERPTLDQFYNWLVDQVSIGALSDIPSKRLIQQRMAEAGTRWRKHMAEARDRELRARAMQRLQRPG